VDTINIIVLSWSSGVLNVRMNSARVSDSMVLDYLSLSKYQKMARAERLRRWRKEMWLIGSCWTYLTLAVLSAPAEERGGRSKLVSARSGRKFDHPVDFRGKRSGQDNEPRVTWDELDLPWNA
jgi:hypothetical protein